jgi:hypothetical protein
MRCADFTDLLRHAALALACSVECLPHAQADEAPLAPVTYVENCVGSDIVELHAGIDSALLDDPERAQIHAAMLARYQQLAADGFAPTAIVLWRSPSFGWIYLALKSHAEKPGKLCSVASFSAAQFELTATLLRKYFLAGRT